MFKKVTEYNKSVDYKPSKNKQFPSNIYQEFSLANDSYLYSMTN